MGKQEDGNDGELSEMGSGNCSHPGPVGSVEATKGSKRAAEAANARPTWHGRPGSSCGGSSGTATATVRGWAPRDPTRPRRPLRPIGVPPPLEAQHRGGGWGRRAHSTLPPEGPSDASHSTLQTCPVLCGCAVDQCPADISVHRMSRLANVGSSISSAQIGRTPIGRWRNIRARQSGGQDQEWEAHTHTFS